MVELAIAGSVALMGIFALIESGRLLWTHNALTDAVRRGARYAVMNNQNAAQVKNVVVYGVPNPPASGGPRAVANDLTPANVAVSYDAFGIKQGRVTVAITGYRFAFTVPLIGATINLGEYKTTLPGEAAGYIPPTI
jgi:Flp pilus assembly protein TadG